MMQDEIEEEIGGVLDLGDDDEEVEEDDDEDEQLSAHGLHVEEEDPGTF